MDLNKNLEMYLIKGDDAGILNTLRRMHIIKMQPETMEPIKLTVTEQDVILLEKVVSYATFNPILIKEVFRCLRNVVVKNRDVQNAVLATRILDFTVEVMDFLNKEQEPSSDFKMVLTFLANLCANNPHAGIAVWEKFEDAFPGLLEEKVFINTSCAIIYNAVRKNILLQPEQCLLEAVFELIRENYESEFLTFLFEHIVRYNAAEVYSNLSVEHRLLILQDLRERIVIKNFEDVISQDFLVVLMKEFKLKSDCILKTVADYLKNVSAIEVAMLLEVLASCSGKEEFVSVAQSDKSFLINSAFLLKSLHDVGKQGDNCFVPIQKLSKMTLDDEVIKQHPGFGFKANLIRLLGNLAWKNRAQQDDIRDFDCIPLLLDCCNMDARNPLIIQWVVFAIRNLCEDNPENQRVVASLKKQGVVSSAALDEMGITLHGDGDSQIKIAPLKFKK